ncbi:unnamed protein product [Xylocopa violacea]|uniref:Uncharacterized protein n=1 Tax=Xylocopa violacea TaxID=135666 RepID=A0ABP1N6K4_XYLVO
MAWKKKRADRRGDGTPFAKIAQEVRGVGANPPYRPRRRRLSEGVRERRVRPGKDRGRGEGKRAVEKGTRERAAARKERSGGRRYGLPTGAYRYTQALCRTEVEYGLYWRHLLHG